MVPLHYFSFRKVLLYTALFFFTFVLVCSYTEAQSPSNDAVQIEDQPIKKKPTTKNQTKLINPTTTSFKHQTKLLKTISNLANNQTKLKKLSLGSTKNNTTLIKPNNDLSKQTFPTIKIKLKKLNSTSKTSNSTKTTSDLAKKSTQLFKLSSAKNKTTKPMSSKQSKPQIDKDLIEIKSKNPEREKKAEPNNTQKPNQPNWTDQEDVDHSVSDLVADFRDLPSTFQETLLPDFEEISTTSKLYLTKSHKQITKGFKPFVGTKYAPTIAYVVSFVFIVIPLILVSLIFTRIKAYFSLQKLLIFIQIYLSIYFAILCFSSLLTGLEPLSFFYATSRSTYVWLQVLQSLGYVLYLLLLLMYSVLVFSTESGPGSKMLGLGQTFVGFSVGLHYYMTVFHRVLLRQPPKTNWKVHGIYATCFLAISLLANADRRKKAYIEYGGEEAKKN